jgi:predicted transposase YbfD/YdcC
MPIISRADAGHGRIEERTPHILPTHKYLSTRRDWKGLAGIGIVESQRTDKLSGKTGGLERRYFIFSDKAMTPELLLRQSRAHWAIENGLHWTLDVVFREDDSQVRTKNAAANLSLARKTALNLLRASPLKMSLRRKRSACARRPERVLEAIAASILRQVASLFGGSLPDLLAGWGDMPARAGSGARTDRYRHAPSSDHHPVGAAAPLRGRLPPQKPRQRGLADSRRRPCGLAPLNGRLCGGPDVGSKPDLITSWLR